MIMVGSSRQGRSIQPANKARPGSLTTMKQSSNEVTAVCKHKLISSAAEAHCAGHIESGH